MRTKLHKEFIERKIGVDKSNAGRRTARKTLIDSLIAKHSQLG